MKQIKLGMVNCYYLQSDQGNILIDTGYAHDKALFLARLAKSGIAIDDIAYILLTHHHDDHCGLVTSLLEHNPKIQLIMHPLCSSLTAKGCNTSEYGGAWCSRRMKMLMALYKKFNVKRSSTYPPFSGREQDILLDFSHGPVLFHGYTIIPTPGHTPDSISLLDGRGNLFCGDASANFLHFAGTKYAPPIITDLQEFYETWKKLLDLPIQQIYPGHGKSFAPDRLEHNLHALKART
ncbi:MAG: MBL fold metallo-hydrolase [Sphaerochaeta sp.]|nr:MBL fold metallo-hydrolase [Sphaerochaeta sp.]